MIRVYDMQANDIELNGATLTLTVAVDGGIDIHKGTPFTLAVAGIQRALSRINAVMGEAITATDADAIPECVAAALLSHDFRAVIRPTERPTMRWLAERAAAAVAAADYSGVEVWIEDAADAGDKQPELTVHAEVVDVPAAAADKPVAITFNEGAPQIRVPDGSK